ncbi:MAG: hypothetical protein AAF399_24225 [Bacteroidota bacterium]
MKQFSLLILWFFWTLPLMMAQPQYDLPDEDGNWQEPPHYEPREELIQVALILDVSGSMDGLLEQAKSQLWFMVNGIMADHPYYAPRLEVAVYEYGRNSLGYRSGYARQLLPFTSDLDWVAETLYDLRTGGSKEYCGLVIDRAVSELGWSPRPQDQRMIFIAGNESFSQGSVSYRSAIERAGWSGIQVHTLFCGEYDAGVRYGWLRAAELGQGVFALIDQQAPRHQRHHHGPSQRWVQLNHQLNATYLPYGGQARTAQQRQLHQDQMAAQYGGAYVEARTRTKASAAYQNPHWDLIDGVNSGQIRLAEIPDHQLPTELRGRSMAQKERIVAQKRADRVRIQQEIAQLQQQDRKAGVPEVRDQPSKRPQRLDEAVVQATRKPTVKPTRQTTRKRQAVQRTPKQPQAMPGRQGVRESFSQTRSAQPPQQANNRSQARPPVANRPRPTVTARPVMQPRVKQPETASPSQRSLKAAPQSQTSQQATIQGSSSPSRTPTVSRRVAPTRSTRSSVISQKK